MRAYINAYEGALRGGKKNFLEGGCSPGDFRSGGIPWLRKHWGLQRHYATFYKIQRLTYRNYLLSVTYWNLLKKWSCKKKLCRNLHTILQIPRIIQNWLNRCGSRRFQFCMQKLAYFHVSCEYNSQKTFEGKLGTYNLCMRVLSYNFLRKGFFPLFSVSCWLYLVLFFASYLEHLGQNYAVFVL